eukprot:scaffold78343_cov63-Phaeocystis_antarctica.AAC.2
MISLGASDAGCTVRLPKNWVVALLSRLMAVRIALRREGSALHGATVGPQRAGAANASSKFTHQPLFTVPTVPHSSASLTS